MKKRILEIIPTLDRAGAEKQLTLLAAGLPPDEFDVRVCALTRGGPLLEDLERAGVSVTVIGKRWKIDPQAFWRLKRLVADWQPDLIHTWIFAANAYVVFFNASWGPVMWVALGEMFPNQVRGAGLGVSGFFQWISNFAITMTFPLMLGTAWIGLTGRSWISIPSRPRLLTW